MYIFLRHVVESATAQTKLYTVFDIYCCQNSCEISSLSASLPSLSLSKGTENRQTLPTTPTHMHFVLSPVLLALRD